MPKHPPLQLKDYAIDDYDELLQQYVSSVTFPLEGGETYSCVYLIPLTTLAKLCFIVALCTRDNSEELEKIVGLFVHHTDYLASMPPPLSNFIDDLIVCYWPTIQTDFEVLCEDAAEDWRAEEMRRSSKSIPPPQMRFGKPDQKNIKKYVREALDDILSERNYHVKK